MSLSAALSNALSGLTASARGAEVISNNVANALTEGYGRRELVVSSRTLGGYGSGVKIEGVTRQVDRFALADRRQADAEAGAAAIRADFLADLEKAIGASGTPGALSTRIDNFESSLIAASARPDNVSAQRDLLTSAKLVTDGFENITDHIQRARVEADSEIARQVQTLNDALAEITRLNAQIVRVSASGGDSSALMDQRQLMIDRVSQIVPVREVRHDGNQAALYTTGGVVLLEASAGTISFSHTPTITPDMTQTSGALSGLTLNGRAISTSEMGGLGGGTLSALFTLRDELAVDAQAQLDGMARDLIDRFADPAVDPSLSTGQAGLFTDNGAAFDPADEVGLSSRLQINAAVDPDHGGALWRLRDGIGASSEGSASDSTLLTALTRALTASRSPASSALSGQALSASGQSAQFLSIVSTDRLRAEDESSFATARQTAFAQALAQGGVDSDAELQKLLQVEQAYAANAKVISTLDDMLQQILNL